MVEWEGEVRELIALGKEGDHWDFKSKHHSDVGDLIKDIVCLANTAHHKGQRYLIFGVSDEGDPVGVPEEDRRTQAQIVDALANAQFANNSYPDVYLRDLEVGGVSVDVLLISDRPEKPYFLAQPYGRGRPKMQAGAVYTRNRDRNTGSDSTASMSDLETMWRERFGLDKSPYERVFDYLGRPRDWTSTGENHWYYTMYPEFTVSPTDDDTREVEGSESWVRAAINPRSFVRPLRVRYHQTELATVACIYYDEMRYLVPAPCATRSDSLERNWFYSITQGTIEFQLLVLLTQRTAKELIEDGIAERAGPRMPVAVFGSKEERRAFLNSLSESPVDHSELLDEDRHADRTVSEYDRDVLQYSRAVLRRLQNWRDG